MSVMKVQNFFRDTQRLMPCAEYEVAYITNGEFVTRCNQMARDNWRVIAILPSGSTNIRVYFERTRLVPDE